VRRLVVFGDSFTVGYAENQEDCTPFPEFLGESLDLEIINKGYRGNSDYVICYDVLNWFRENPDKIKDSVFLCVFSGWRRGYKVIAYEDGKTEVRGGYKKKFDADGEMNLPQIHRHQVETSHWALVKLFEEYNVPFLFTSSFSDIKKFNYDFILPPKKYYIEGDVPNNTLLDICKDTWGMKSGPIPIKHYLTQFHLDFRKGSKASHDCLTDCGHPNEKGSKKIAKFLEPYILKAITE